MYVGEVRTGLIVIIQTPSLCRRFQGTQNLPPDRLEATGLSTATKRSETNARDQAWLEPVRVERVALPVNPLHPLLRALRSAVQPAASLPRASATPPPATTTSG